VLQTLQALLNQTADQKKYEIIVVDDGSHDNTADVLSEIQKQNGSAIKVFHQKNQLAGIARNYGISKAKGDIILFLDDDILSDSELVSHHLAFHEKHTDANAALLGRLTTLPGEVDLIRNDKYTSAEDAELYQAVHFSRFRTANTSVKRELLVKAGGFAQGLYCLQDTDLAIRMHEQGLELFYSQETLGYHLKPIDTIDKVVNNGKKYGGAYAELSVKNDTLRRDIHVFTGRLNLGWKEGIHHPVVFLKDALRRIFINRYTIHLIVRITKKQKMTTILKPIYLRLFKEIWSYSFRHEFLKKRRSLEPGS